MIFLEGPRPNRCKKAPVQKFTAVGVNDGVTSALTFWLAFCGSLEFEVIKLSAGIKVQMLAW